MHRSDIYPLKPLNGAEILSLFLFVILPDAVESCFPRRVHPGGDLTHDPSIRARAGITGGGARCDFAMGSSTKRVVAAFGSGRPKTPCSDGGKNRFQTDADSFSFLARLTQACDRCCGSVVEPVSVVCGAILYIRELGKTRDS